MFSTIKQTIKEFACDESGDGGINYVVMIVVVVAAVAAGAALLAEPIARLFQRGANTLDSAGG